MKIATNLKLSLLFLGVVFSYAASAQWQYDLKTDIASRPSLSLEVTSPQRLALELGFAYSFEKDDVLNLNPPLFFVQGTRIFPRHRWGGFLSLQYYVLWFKQNHGMAVGLRTRIDRPAYISPLYLQAYEAIYGTPFNDIKYFTISAPISYKVVLKKRFIAEIVIAYGVERAKRERDTEARPIPDIYNLDLSLNLGYRFNGKRKKEVETSSLY